MARKIARGVKYSRNRNVALAYDVKDHVIADGETTDSFSKIGPRTAQQGKTGKFPDCRANALRLRYRGGGIVMGNVLHQALDIETGLAA